MLSRTLSVQMPYFSTRAGVRVPRAGWEGVVGRVARILRCGNILPGKGKRFPIRTHSQEFGPIMSSVTTPDRVLVVAGRLSLSRVFGRLLAAIGIVAAASACTPGFEGEYSDPAKSEIVDDKWNETDARKTAEVLVKAALEKPWLANYVKVNKGERPVVIVDDMENRTDEHIDTRALTGAIQDELINSGRVRFVDGARRQKILDEIKFQNSGAVDAKSAKKTGKQIGADYMMVGEISSKVATQDKLKTVTYQTILQLTNVETAEIEWSERHQIKKRFRRSGAGW